MEHSNGVIALVQLDAFYEDLQKFIKESIREAIQKFNFYNSSEQVIVKEDSLLTRKQAAALLNISLPSLTKYMVEGKLQYSRIGRKVLFDKAQILENIKCISKKA
jgi:excisionase family DNA binding protein